MRNKLKPLTFFRIAFWVSLVLLLSDLAGIYILVAIPSLAGDLQLFYISILLVLGLVFTFGLAQTLSQMASQKQFLLQLSTENLFMLGEATEFYNIDAFKNRVNKLCRRHSYKKYNKYITAFTPTSMSVASSKTRNAILKNLNLRLTRFMDEIFDMNNKNGFDHARNVYAFSRGIFYICTFTNDASEVHKIINVLSNEMFRMVNEDKIKIWVQPFFGIREMKKDSNVVVAVEDALLAREISEKNYESFTFFKDSFRKVDNSSTDEIAIALENNEFIPYYQPKYSLKEKRFVSSEALARWNSPVHGILPPGKFIEEAEKSGLLHAIDLHIFRCAVKDIGENLKRGRPVLPVSVNFSLYEFFSRNFLSLIVDTLKQYQVPAKYIEIEITETTSQVNKFLSLSVIKKVKELGVRVLMDDFGVGYSQVENLRQIPFDAIKIDKSYTDKLLKDEKDRSIFKYLVELGHVNDLEVIVEGVENKEQVEMLRKMKVDTIQGFYYSKPIPLDEFVELLKKQNEGGVEE